MFRCENSPVFRNVRMGVQCMGGALAIWVVCSSACVEAAALDKPYRLTAGDTLNVVVFDQKEFSGDFGVDGAGQILLPVAGAVKVIGLTVPEVQELIQQTLSNGILVRPSVSVRIDKYRPIFINGDVKNPGSYPFQFGQSVNAMIATAGGRQRTATGDIMSEFIRADERVRVLHTSRLELLVRKARLEAERDGTSRFTIPQLVAYDSEGSDTSSIYATENDTFKRVMMTYRNQLDLLQKQKPRLESEIEAVTEQLDKEQNRLSLVNERIASLEQYQKKGLVRSDVLYEQQREYASVEAEIAKLKAKVARLQTDSGDLDIKIGDAKATFDRRVLGDLQDTLQQLRKIDATMGSARKLRTLRARLVSYGGKPDSVIRITRLDQNGSTTFEANSNTLLEPGDVIEVQDNDQENESTPSAEKNVMNDRMEFSAVSAHRLESDDEMERDHDSESR